MKPSLAKPEFNQASLFYYCTYSFGSLCRMPGWQFSIAFSKGFVCEVGMTIIKGKNRRKNLDVFIMFYLLLLFCKLLL